MEQPEITVQQPNTPIFQTLWVRQPSAPAIVLAAVTASCLSFTMGALYSKAYDYLTEKTRNTKPSPPKKES